MTTAKLLEQSKVQKIGKKPVVVLPLSIWKEIEDRLEDVQANESKSFKKKIAKARMEKKFYSSSQVKELLRI
ncbi:MAG: hypothetical protein AAB646_02545 [Patescibacteria group bacterium]